MPSQYLYSQEQAKAKTRESKHLIISDSVKAAKDLYLSSSLTPMPSSHAETSKSPPTRAYIQY